MGGGGKKSRKQFVDRRNSATYRFVTRAGAADDSDRVFVRVDNNEYNVAGFLDDGDEHHLAADAADQLAGVGGGGGDGPLPEHVRREILELGLPDDGYNYLLHLREIRRSGAGAFVPSHRAQLDRLPLDVKVYDASRLRISSDAGDDVMDEGRTIHAVAAKTAAVRRVEKAVDPDVARLLDETDVSRCWSDAEDLEEDFVIKANHREGDGDEEEEDEEEGKKGVGDEHGVFGDADEEDGPRERVRRLLDEQFDLLAYEEYGDNEDDDEGGDAEVELTPEVIDELKLFHGENIEAEEEYRAPADFVHGKQETGTQEQVDASADLIRKCAEYAERYLNESGEDKDVVLVSESSDESEAWDCETILSTYSNLDNHPGKIQAPGDPKKRVPKVFPGETAVKHDVIKLQGKEMLPVQYLPQKKRNGGKEKKPKPIVTSSEENLRSRIHGKESKEEKKERKAAVKEERREARKVKKELKGLYKCETQKGQRAAAVSGPSSIRLM